jgi:hypothetical protein
MTSVAEAESVRGRIGLLDRERIIAHPSFNRWLVPPAALAIHLCIGIAYGFSVFWLPLGRAVGVAQGLGKPIACPGDATTFFGKVAMTAHALFATECDWADQTLRKFAFNVSLRPVRVVASVQGPKSCLWHKAANARSLA